MASKRLPILLAVWLALFPSPHAVWAGGAPETPDAAGVQGPATPAVAVILPSGDNAAISGGSATPEGLPSSEAGPPGETTPAEIPSSDTGTPAPVEPPDAPSSETTTIPPAPAPAGDNAVVTDNTWLDRYHGFIEKHMYRTADWVDRSVGGEQVQGIERARSSLWWKNDFAYYKDQHFVYRTAFRASIWLPRLKNRWHLLIAGENQGDPTVAIPVDPGNPGTNVASQVSALSTELVYDLFRTKQTIFRVGAGVQVKIPPDAYARVRFGYVQPLGSDTLARFTATAYYHAKEGPGESNQLVFERRLSPATLLQWANSATIEEGSNGWNWGTELTLGHALSPVSALTLGGSVKWSTRPIWEVQNYRVYTGYRRPVLRPWLFCELIPDMNWPLQTNGGREPVWGVRLRLEVLFLGNELAYLTH